MLKQSVAGVAVAVMLAGVAAAGPLEDGVDAYTRSDYATALRLWEPLAEQGDARAQASLGGMYARGEGVPSDVVEAVRWYRLAAEHGHTGAQINLGFRYTHGLGVPQDFTEGVRWYQMAADRGDAAAQVALGFMYAKGNGVPQDYVLAHVWWNLAATQGNEMAKENRDLAASHMTPDQLAEAQRLAKEWKPVAER